MSANHINVAEWEQLFQTSKGKAPARPAPAPVASKTSNDEGLLARATGTGSLKTDTVVYDDLTLNNVQSSVTLDHGTITIKPLTANLYNGQQIGTIVVNTHTTPITYTVDSKLQNVDANQLLSAISPVKQTLYGILSANADTHFTTATGARSILPTLDGKVSLNLKDGKIANVDLLHQLATIAQFQRSAGAVEPFTHLVQLTGDFDIHNGVAQTNNLKAAIDAGSIAVKGVIDLAHESLNLHLTAVLAQNYSQSVGGTNIGGFLNTALANPQGELVIPVVVTGTFQQPHFAPDLQAVANLKLQKLLPGLENPGGLENTIFGQILRSKPGAPPAQQQQQQEPSNPVNDLLNIFQKGKR
jgi:AsmA protein